MSLENTVYVALLAVSHVTGITGTLSGYAEQARLADVTHMRKFAATMRSNDPEWLREGIQFFAYDWNGRSWESDIVTWAIMSDASKIDKADVVAIFAEAFAKWATALSLRFKFVSPEQNSKGVGIWFKAAHCEQPSQTEYISTSTVLDNCGVNIIFDDNLNWTDESGEDYHNLRFAALYEIGHILGLADSNEDHAIMSAANRNYHYKTRGNPFLLPDDTDGIKTLYRTLWPGQNFLQCCRAGVKNSSKKC